MMVDPEDLGRATGPADPNRALAYVVGRNPIFDGVTDDGTKVFFSTYVPLVPEDHDNCYDIYSRADGQTELLSTGPSDSGCPDTRAFAGASTDGSRVFFTSGAHLTPSDTDSGCQYFDTDDFEYFPTTCADVYERRAGVTTLVSTAPAGGNGPYQSSFGGASRDGKVVAFNSEEPLVAED